MRASTSGTASGRGDSGRPSSQNGRDQLVVEAQDMPLAGKILHVRVYHVTVGTPSSSPLVGALSPVRGTTPDVGATSQSLGFRVLAIDELDNEFSLFVSRQKAEFLSRPQSPAVLAPSGSTAVTAAPTLEVIANSIIDHLDIIGNRNRDIGKLTCREPEVHVAKRTRAMPAKDAASKQKNPHLLAKNDQRAARAQKRVLRTMEAIATAKQQDSGAAHEHEVLSPRSRRSRKSSDDSLLHRMAFSNDKPVWRSDLETSYEEQHSKLSDPNAASEASLPMKAVPTSATLLGSSSSATVVATSSAPRRVIPERKHKHKDLYARREKERKQRLLVTRAKSSSNLQETESTMASSPSVAALVVLERPGKVEEPPKPLPDPHTVRARFNAAVRTAYAVRTFLGVKTPPENEQFLRRRTVDHNDRRVLGGSDFNAFPGMGVEITHERPLSRGEIDEDDPLLQEKLRILTQAARRSSFVRDKDGNLVRRSASSRGGSRRNVGAELLTPLVASASAPALGATDDSDVVKDADEVQEAIRDANDDRVAAKEEEEEEEEEEKQNTEPSPTANNELELPVSPLDVPKSEVSTSQPGLEESTSSQASSPDKAVDEEVCGESDGTDGATNDADPEIVFEPGSSPQSATLDLTQERQGGEAVSLLSAENDQDASAVAAVLPIQVDAGAAAVPENSLPASMERIPTGTSIAAPPRQKCWDDATSAEAALRSVRGDGDSEQALAHFQVVNSENVAAPKEQQPPQQPRPRPKSAGDPPPTKSGIECAVELVLPPSYPTETADPVRESVEGDSLMPNSARESRHQPTVGVSASNTRVLLQNVVTVGDDGAPSAPLTSSELICTSDFSPIDIEVTKDTTCRGEEAAGSGESLDSLGTTVSTGREAVRVDAPRESTEQMSRSDSDVDYTLSNVTNGGSDRSGDGIAVNQVDSEDASLTSGRSVATPSVAISDDQVSAIASAASAAVIAVVAAETSIKQSASPPSNMSPQPTNATRDSSPSPKSSSKTYVASSSSSQRGGPALPRDPRNSPSKRRASVFRQQPSQALTDAKQASRRKSVAKGAFLALPDLSNASSLEGGGGSSGAGTHDVANGHYSVKSRRRRSVDKSLALAPTPYHKTWSKWVNGRGIIEKISCLQLEEQVLAGLQTEGALVKLGLRYARWSGTSLAAILLLEHAAALHESAPRTHEFWNSMGNAHLDIFLCHRKFLPAASFHLERCVKSLTRAFAFMESMADPQLLLRFALCLFWHPEQGHLERADDIFRQLLAKFGSFCDKDRMNLLFLHFQVLHRLKMFAEACECIDKVIALASSTVASATTTAASAADAVDAQPPADKVAASPPAYELTDYWMMKMQCQQASGDYVQATATFSRVVGAKGFSHDANLADEQYLELWLGVADKCFHLEDYALAAEYLPVALNFAKDSRLLAALHYKLGLCFQALGDGARCVVEYKRARNMNRHERPPVSLAELRGSYDDQFALLLDKPVRQVIEEVRVNLYDHAVRQLQRMFRRRKRQPAPSGPLPVSDNTTEVKMPSLVSRKMSRPLSRSRPISGSLQAPDSAGASATATEAAVADAGGPGKGPEETEGDVVARRQAAFKARKQRAVDQMKRLRAAASFDVNPPGLSSTATRAVRGTTQSELLSPEKERPEVHRLRSMATFKQLGYLPSVAPCVEHWEQLLALASDLFPTRRSVTRATCAIRAVLPRIGDDVAFCALADALGDVGTAVERLRDATYERELSFVCSVLDVGRTLEQALPVRLPSISSPSRSSESLDARTQPSDAERLTKSPLATSPRSSPSLHAKRSRPPTPQVSPRPTRLGHMIEAQLQQHLQRKTQSIESAAHDSGEKWQRHEEFAVLRDFRQVNATLVAAQSPTGLKKLPN